MTDKQALIVWGGWPGHTPEESAALVAAMLRLHGFAVTVSDTTAAWADPGLGAMDLIVPMVTMSQIAREEVEGLTAAVRAGTGLARCRQRTQCEYPFSAVR